MTDKMDGEMYIFMGTQNKTHFFVHSKFNEKFTPDMSYQIYNVLINDKFIGEPEETVIIYELEPYSGKKDCNVVCITHELNKSQPKLKKKNLEEFLPALFKQKRDEIYVVKYDYSKGCYLSYRLEEFDKKMFMMDEETRMKVKNIAYIMTKKPIN